METEQLYTLLANIPDVVWTTDSTGKTIFIGPNVERVYGYTPDEIYQASEELWLERIHPDDVESVRKAYESLFGMNEIFDVEYRIQRKDGHWIWLHDRAVATYEKEGATYTDGVFSDVTARVQAERQRDLAQKALQEREQEATVLTEMAKLVSGTLDLQQVLNRTAEYAMDVFEVDPLPDRPI